MIRQAGNALVLSGVCAIEQARKNGSVDHADLKKKIKQTKCGGKKGVYLVGVRGSRKSIPAWVGRATRQSFEAECCSDHVLSKIRDTLLRNRGTPILFLIPQGKPGQGKADVRAIVALEKKMIGIAHAANPRILNKYGLSRKSNAQAEEPVRSFRRRPNRDEALLWKMLTSRK
ncbi:MAG: hypothetical protein WBP56_25800 [Polyangia bacterium]